MRFTGYLPGVRLDLDRYYKVLDLAMRDAIAKGAVAWLGAVTAKIPVWSGASQATLMPLASSLGFSLAISPVAKSRIGLGISNGSGEIHVDSSAGTYEFEYGTSLGYLIFNEFNNANEILGPSGRPYFHLKNPGPYHFQDAGQQAFEKEARDVYVPSPLDYLANVPVKV